MHLELWWYIKSTTQQLLNKWRSTFNSEVLECLDRQVGSELNHNTGEFHVQFPPKTLGGFSGQAYSLEVSIVLNKKFLKKYLKI